MPTYEGLRLKVQKYKRVLFANSRRRKLKTENFTIISNNCWGGTVYESYNLQKQSPTVGMFFMAKDYIKFCTHLKEYLSAELKFIPPETAQGASYAKHDKRFGTYPVGVLTIKTLGGGYESVEIFFLHYHSQKEAEEKWKRRCERVCFDRLLVKFNDQNECTPDDILKFDNLPYKNKICFTVKDYPGCKSVIKVHAPKSHKYIRASYEPFGRSRYININKLINSL